MVFLHLKKKCTMFIDVNENMKLAKLQFADHIFADLKLLYIRKNIIFILTNIGLDRNAPIQICTKRKI
jgi:hypothetical protein